MLAKTLWPCGEADMHHAEEVAPAASANESEHRANLAQA